MRRLLIVEDDSIYAALLARKMRARGYRVEVAEELADAFTKARTFLPEQVILDLNLKGENGIELIPEILENNRGARIIMLTSYGNLRAAARAVRLGAADVLAKPLTVEEIEYALNGPGSADTPNAVLGMGPDVARDTHIAEFYEKNDRNVSKTARVLDMHRRTLQRLLKKSKIIEPDKSKGVPNTGFGRARRLARFWSSVIQSNMPSD